jgi:uncharacterized membrane protein
MVKEDILFLMNVALLPFSTSALNEGSTTLTFDEASSSARTLLFTSGSHQIAVAFYAGSVA